MSKDIAASVRARLLNLAKQRKEDFDFILRQFVIQRVLYRLSASDYADQFLLKGALLFWIWNQEFHRPTIDIYLLGFGSNDIKDLQQLFNTVCAIAAEDGLEFDLSSIKANEIKKDEEYQGVRVTGLAKLTKARIKFQIDIGFGDAVTPGPETAELPSFLDFPEPELQVYPIYTVVAEKFQAMVELDLANSRIKDFYDIWILMGQVDFDGEMLAKAITATFERRNTEFEDAPPNVFTESFKIHEIKQVQWKAFLNKNRLESELTFSKIIAELQTFLDPVYRSCQTKDFLMKRWSAIDKSWI